ncbi:MAG: dihydrolipoyl dehydrogenase [Bacteroidales bacterium]|nr:dihydrolipoyl dehydrogenase [Bacteroidales bacterium]
MIFDVAIIGGGPAGYTAAEKSATNGLKTILFEKSAVGGVCLNVGCIPTKTLLYSAKIIDSIKNSSKYGIISAEPTFDLPKIIQRKTKVVKKLTAGVRAKLAAHEVLTVMGEASVVSANEEVVSIAVGEETYQARKLILCTGSETVIPPIPGLSETNYWTSTEALESKELPSSLVIIGGGVIGVEFASFYTSMGVPVTVVEMIDEILTGMDREISALLRAEYTKKGVKFMLSTKVIALSNSAVEVEVNGNKSTIEAGKILLSVGRRPVLNGFGLENIEIKRYKNGLAVNQNMQTSQANIYACGDVTGFSLLAHTAVREAEVAVNHILGKTDKMSYNSIPAVVYTNPEVAGIGETEESAQSKFITYSVKNNPMTFSGRFVAENELFNGLFKVILDESERVIGVHIFGNPASELIALAAMAIDARMTLTKWQRTVFPHPSVSEIFKEI